MVRAIEHWSPNVPRPFRRTTCTYEVQTKDRPRTDVSLSSPPPRVCLFVFRAVSLCVVCGNDNNKNKQQSRILCRNYYSRSYSDYYSDYLFTTRDKRGVYCESVCEKLLRYLRTRPLSFFFQIKNTTKSPQYYIIHSTMPVRPRGGGGEESAVAAVAAASSNSTSAAVATRSTSTSTTTTANTRTSPGGGGDPHHSPEPPFASHRPTANIPTDESSSLSSPNHHHKSSSSSSLPLGSDNNNTQTADNNNNDTKKSTACLHCQQPFPPFTTKQDFRRLQEEHVQVRCEGCTNYICSDCHWCHEYQANHEIRVCDRCEGFYCKLCDEMDQCDDCGEVVCQHCTTLLSCKFCGGGLCEECATACGRYVWIHSFYSIRMLYSTHLHRLLNL